MQEMLGIIFAWCYGGGMVAVVVWRFVQMIKCTQKVRATCHYPSNTTKITGGIYLAYRYQGKKIESSSMDTYLLGIVNKKYRRGTQIEAYIDPKNPERVTTQRYPTGIMLLKVLFGGFLFGAGVYQFVVSILA